MTLIRTMLANQDNVHYIILLMFRSFFCIQSRYIYICGRIDLPHHPSLHYCTYHVQSMHQLEEKKVSKQY